MSSDPHTKPAADTVEILKPDSMLAQLVETIGWAATIQLCGRFGGDEIYVPKPDSVMTAQRNADIVHDYHNGLTFSDLAKKHGITTTYARIIVNRVSGRNNFP